ncbi:DeoR/GlpR family DNA-binding transcription regulator [Tengunoibacter tsumagoiensis]|uniref:DeoR family transcriptional regulator n=1 Tax=Tengunoibacter tsumagoiensis TaxID=2014871 RepID=A0A402A661_9CHLR|nr:DeoR/GlpR family DNA-binding transcription regulator [Tengunoibacter tsumagoiensis]GCE14637.1 DeoR family transcriptional regulator [Tengunoibacter tsumagoiensis]
MIPYIRREKILEIIGQREIVYLPQLLEIFTDASESTLRRDLKILSTTGHITLLHGGAVKLKVGSTVDLPIQDKLTLNKTEKDAIARTAASFVSEGDVIYLDSSTTVLPMVHYLKGKKITIITSSARLLSLLDDENITCIVLGGEVVIQTGSIVGSITENLLSTMFFDKAFVGANGFSQLGGINTPDYREARKKQIVKQNSKAMYLLMDSSKAEVTTFCKVFELQECTIITDSDHELLGNFLHSIIVAKSDHEC